MFFVFLVAFLGFVAADQCVVSVEDGKPSVKVENFDDGKTRWNPDPAKRCK